MVLIIRWTSEDGTRKWLYPVEKDIHTKGKIVKQISTSAKVIGITKVNIPSPMHPIIPYNILLLEDEHGNRLPKKVMTKYEIEDTYETKPAETEGAVVVTKIKYDIFEYLKQSLSFVHDAAFSADDKILICPSIIEPAYGYQAVTTNPKIVDALIKTLKEKGVTDIIVGTSAMLGNDVSAAAKKAGILSVCEKNGAAFVDLSKAEFVEKEYEGKKYAISKEVIDRKVINLPVFKTNSQIGLSGAMENLIRVCDKKTQMQLCNENINESLPGLVGALPKMLHICDATIGLQGNGPTLLGEPAFLNMVFLSKDAVALDSVLTHMSMIDVPDYIKNAGSVGNNNVKSIEIVGDELEAIRFHIKAANKETAHPNIELIDGYANPADFGAALKISGKLFGLLGHRMFLVIGKHLTKEMVAGKDRLVAYGSDAITALTELGITPIAEIKEDMDTVEKIMLLKSVLEDAEKKSISPIDKAKSKMASFGMKIKQKIVK